MYIELNYKNHQTTSQERVKCLSLAKFFTIL